MRVLLIIAVILALRFILNLSKYLRTKKYYDAYIRWLAIEGESSVVSARAQVVALLKDAGVKDSYVGTVQPAGYGYMATGNASVMDNFPNAREDFATLTNAMFLQALGTYRSRMLQTFNPLFWIEFLIHLPRYTLRYLGVSPDAVVIKLAQIVWWVFCAVLGFLYALYRPDLETAVRGLLRTH